MLLKYEDIKRCIYCACPIRDLKALERHQERGKNCENRYDFMTVNNIYVCHLGCVFETTEKSHFAKHLVMDHTSKELYLWGFKKEKLKNTLLPEDLAQLSQQPNVDDELEIYDEQEHIKPLDRSTKNVYLKMEINRIIPRIGMTRGSLYMNMNERAKLKRSKEKGEDLEEMWQ